MSQPFMSRNDALAGLGNLLNTPLARGAVRYWWVSLPVAGLGWYYWKQREKKGDQSIGNLVHDMAPALSVIGAMIALNAAMAKDEERKGIAPLPAALQPSKPVEASFTPMSPANADVPIEATVVQ